MARAKPKVTKNSKGQTVVTYDKTTHKSSRGLGGAINTTKSTHTETKYNKKVKKKPKK